MNTFENTSPSLPQQTNVIPDSPPPLSSPHHSSHKKLLFFLIFLILLLSAGAVTYLFSISKHNSTVTNITPSQSPQSFVPPTSSITSPTPGKTLNVQNLTSVYGYTINYPTGWFVSPASIERSGSVDQIESYDSSKIKSPGKSGFEKGQAKIEIGPYQNIYDLDGVEESLSLNGDQYQSKEKISFSGYPAIKIIQESPGGKSTTYYVTKEYPKVYHISIYGDMSGDMQEKIDQILSTFKLL